MNRTSRLAAGVAAFVVAGAACVVVVDCGAADESAPDAGAADAPAGDVASGESSAMPDVAFPMDTSPAVDAGVSDAAAADALDAGPSCEAGAGRCNGSTPQSCVNGQWQDEPSCSGAKPVCAAGVCTADPPSCAGGGAGAGNDCGGTGTVDCCATLGIVGGTYDRGYSYTDAGGPFAQAAPATVSDFRLDEFEVTVGRFRKFVAAWNGGDAGYFPPAGSGKHTHLAGGLGLVDGESAGAHETGWVAADDANVAPTNANLACSASASTWTPSPGADESRPINCVSWYEAYAFCIWDGGFLPSEAEWEYAAAGGAADREYPWGSAPPGQSSQYAIYGCFFGNDAGTCLGLANIAPVGTPLAGRGAWGQLDLAGNVQEWVLDYIHLDPLVPCTDCAALSNSGAAERLYRGGNWNSSRSELLPTSAGASTPTFRNGSTGFRCARTP